MKKHPVILTLLFALTILVGAIVVWYINKENTALRNKTSIDLNADHIEKITVKTQMTDVVTEVIVPKEKWNELAEKLNTISLQKINEEKKNGWEYFFRIEYKDQSVTQISFMGNRAYIDNSIYETGNYQSDMFLYLFE